MRDIFGDQSCFHKVQKVLGGALEVRQGPYKVQLWLENQNHNDSFSNPDKDGSMEVQGTKISQCPSWRNWHQRCLFSSPGFLGNQKWEVSNTLMLMWDGVLVSWARKWIVWFKIYTNNPLPLHENLPPSPRLNWLLYSKLYHSVVLSSYKQKPSHSQRI